MKKIFYAAASIALALPVTAAAQFKLPDSGSLGLKGGLVELLGQVIKTFLTIVGALALGYLVYGGFLYITSAGSQQKIDAGKSIITYAIIGIIFIGLAWSIVSFLVNAFIQ